MSICPMRATGPSPASSSSTAASINYRLSGEAKWPAQINDVKAAIRFLRANAASYRLNPDRFAVWGSSASGHLAALAGTSGGVAALRDGALGNPGVSDRVQAVIDMYGPVNFLAMDEQFTAAGVSGQVHNTADSPVLHPARERGQAHPDPAVRGPAGRARADPRKGKGDFRDHQRRRAWNSGVLH